MARSAELVRPRSGRVIAGVCAALARRFGVKPWQVRLLFVLSCLLIVGNTLWTRPVESLAGLGIVLLGLLTVFVTRTAEAAAARNGKAA